MSNIISRSYTLNFDKATGLYVEEIDGSMPCIEYTSNGVTQRVVNVENKNDLKKREFRTVIEHHTLIDGEWIPSKDPAKPLGKDTTFVNLATGEPAEWNEATEIVDDLDAELMDNTDPENPIPYNPPRYSKKQQVKVNYVPDSVALLSSFGPNLFPHFELIMKRQYNLTNE